ncbi:MAG: aldehyde ferredoxin oxidoreductase N-terminal domain-containing protein [Promethearchaeota archaeon]
MSYGFFGKINLIDKTFKEELLCEILHYYLRGYELALKSIYENMPTNTEEFAPKSLLGFFSGLLTGTSAPISRRYMVCGKSPPTRTWGDSNSEGPFGLEIKICLESREWISLTIYSKRT